MSVLTIILGYSQSLLDEYPKAFIVNADNVGSKQMQQIRQALRGKAGMCLNALNSLVKQIYWIIKKKCQYICFTSLIWLYSGIIY